VKNKQQNNKLDGYSHQWTPKYESYDGIKIKKYVSCPLLCLEISRTRGNKHIATPTKKKTPDKIPNKKIIPTPKN
jgi:hypothetical protein